MTELSYRPTWIEVDLDAIRYNVNQLQQRLSNTTKIYAVVKANGYGHGDAEVAKAALQSGAEALAVALLEEAIKLREAGITAPIIVLGWVAPEHVPIAAKEQITLTFFQKEWLQQVKSQDFKELLKLHLKVDTGMGRIGIQKLEEIKDILKEVDDPRFCLEGMFTHFATADESELTYYQEQKTMWESSQDIVQANWPDQLLMHTGNSAASMRFPQEMQDYVRFGIGMYGLYPSPVVKEEKPIPLKPALSLHARLVHVKKVPPGKSISYGATYTISDEEWIGTIQLGYADGLDRKLQGSDVLVNGRRMPLVGKICMDQCMVKLDQHYPIGTHVIVIGEQDKEIITMDEIAGRLGTINYEIACMFSDRIPRFYKGAKV